METAKLVEIKIDASLSGDLALGRACEDAMRSNPGMISVGAWMKSPDVIVVDLDVVEPD